MLVGLTSKTGSSTSYEHKTLRIKSTERTPSSRRRSPTRRPRSQSQTSPSRSGRDRLERSLQQGGAGEDQLERHRQPQSEPEGGDPLRMAVRRLERPQSGDGLHWDRIRRQTVQVAVTKTSVASRQPDRQSFSKSSSLAIGARPVSPRDQAPDASEPEEGGELRDRLLHDEARHLCPSCGAREHRDERGRRPSGSSHRQLSTRQLSTRQLSKDSSTWRLHTMRDLPRT
jgi:hypothetical protein